MKSLFYDVLLFVLYSRIHGLYGELRFDIYELICFQDVFPADFGPTYDKAIQTLMWLFLSRLEKLLPTQTLQQVDIPVSSHTACLYISALCSYTKDWHLASQGQGSFFFLKMVLLLFVSDCHKRWWPMSVFLTGNIGCGCSVVKSLKMSHVFSVAPIIFVYIMKITFQEDSVLLSHISFPFVFVRLHPCSAMPHPFWMNAWRLSPNRRSSKPCWALRRTSAG